MPATISLEECRALAFEAFSNVGVCRPQAEETADHITRAEADGCKSHGLFRLPGFIASVRSGSADPQAEPDIVDAAPGLVAIDGRRCFAPLSVARGRVLLAAKARSQGIACMTIRNSLNFSALWPDIEPLAEQGFVAFTFINSQSFVAPAGGTQALFGTNPMAFACPRADGRPPMAFDQASSATARGELQIAARDGHEVPPGSGLGPDGQPTTDPSEILKGVQLPFGGYKGSAIALMVDLMTGGLSGGFFGYESRAAYNDDGGPANTCQSFIAIDPLRLAGPGFRAHVEALFERLLADGDARLPGDRRLANRARTANEGITVEDRLYATVRELAGRG